LKYNDDDDDDDVVVVVVFFLNISSLPGCAPIFLLIIMVKKMQIK
jgi:hypothetical protein